MKKNSDNCANPYSIEDLIWFAANNPFLFFREEGDPPSNESIKKFEEMLNIKLTPDYKRFLQEFGYMLVIGGLIDFYGITFDNPCEDPDNAALLTLELRKNSNLPHYYLAFYDDEGDEQWCLDTREENPKVVIWDFFEQCVSREEKFDFVNIIFEDIKYAVENLDDEEKSKVKWPESRE